MGFKLEAPPIHPVLLASTATGVGMEHAALMKRMRHAHVLIALLRDGLHPESVGGTVELRDDGTPVLEASASLAPDQAPTLLEARMAELREPGPLVILSALHVGMTGAADEPVRMAMDQSMGALYPFSLAHAAIPTTGDFYVGVSYGDGDTDTTEIWYENAWSNDTWRSAAVFDEMSYVDISAKIVVPKPCSLAVRWGTRELVTAQSVGLRSTMPPDRSRRTPRRLPRGGHAIGPGHGAASRGR